jgi:hypothetical protein
LWGQEADREMISTRAAEIESLREKKAQELRPEELSGTERALQTIKEKRLVERITGGAMGLRARLGGLATGSGFGAGPEYYRRFRNDRVVVRSSIRASLKNFYAIDAGIAFPRLASDRAFLNFGAGYRNSPRIDYYGQGPESRKSGRSSYAFEEGGLEARGGVRPFGRGLAMGLLGRHQRINVGPGRDERFGSTQTTYGPDTTPGLLEQSNYLAAGLFAAYDNRDNPGGPRSGGYYGLEFSNYIPRELPLGHFRRFDVEAQQYFSFTNRRRVIALRANAVLTNPRAGEFVPFYLQPTLGGSDSLRGFRAWRFYDNNRVVMTGEYRWEVFSGLDMALFADFGEVFHRVRDFAFSGLEQSYGFGFRFNVRNDVFLRLDTGFSREGFQIWFKFNNVF